MLKRVSERSVLIALDPAGKSLSSEELAKYIKGQMENGNSSFTFATGGAVGWSPEMKQKAKLQLSLSRMTFPHEIARMLMVEQFYRAMCIINGHPYHK